ncbi:MAG: ATP-binding cassette domain-containing protein, partial [Acetobacteraceae bacterium]
VTVNGEPPGSPRAAWARGIAVVFQEILIAEGASVLDNLFLGHDGLFVARMGWRQKRERAAELLARLAGAPVALDQPIEELPLVVRQWVVIGRALLGGPRLVVFDESTAALDRSGVERLFEVVRRLRGSGVCVLIVTHRIHELTAIADRATVLSDGRDVGTLEGGGITEARLLALMQGPGHALPQVQAEPAPAAAARHGGRRLMVSKLRLAPEAAPIDLDVACGEIVGLAGLEGQGQVEFIQAVSGIGRTHRGEVFVERDGRRLGIDSAASAERARIAYIPGDRKVEGVFANLSVFENFGIACWRRTARAGLIDRRRVHGMFRACVEKLSVRIGRESAPINSLSGGNQQKVVVG